MDRPDGTAGGGELVFGSVSGLEVFLAYMQALNKRVEALTGEVAELRRLNATAPADRAAATV
ncbi:hypothetical protein [Catellatospora sp. NPDC049609]|uniref:hypothetical protein n=1 Tax=Catellatospora sp. NPDC049609 TaxID=3155505 RepID=UPI00341BBCAA